MTLVSISQSMAGELPNDILFTTNSGFGGFGRLNYDPSSGCYRLVDGRIFTYVVDGNSIRLMRPEESGGSMANPTKIVVLHRKIFTSSAYGQVNEINPATGEFSAKFAYNKFVYGGGGSELAMYASSSALALLQGNRILLLSDGLNKVGEIALEEKVRHVRLSREYVQEEAKLYSVEIDRPNTYMDCQGSCRVPDKIRQTTIDFSNPSAVKVENHEEIISTQDFYPHKAVDGKRKGWLIVHKKYNQDKTVLAWHPFEHLASPRAELVLPENTNILAMTKTRPFVLVLQGGNSYDLGIVELAGEKLKLERFPMPWLKGSSFSFGVQTDSENRIYVTANHQLAVYKLSPGGLERLLQQDFVSPSNGAGQFQFENVIPADLPEFKLSVNRGRLEALLHKDYWDERDHLAIQAEIEKIAPQDKWAIPLFTELLGKRSQSYRGGIVYSAAALAKFGPGAQSAVPALISSTMEGSAIRGDALAAVKPAIAKIDPKGTATREFLPACIAKSYVCDYVGKQIMEALPK